MRNVTFFIAAIVIIFSASCRNGKEAHISLNTEILSKPFVPLSIQWEVLDTSTPEDSVAIFRTFYLFNDSVIYMFNCINHKDVHCKDTSIYDVRDHTYNDTVTCRYEDSIRFGV